MPPNRLAPSALDDTELDAPDESPEPLSAPIRPSAARVAPYDFAGMGFDPTKLQNVDSRRVFAPEIQAAQRSKNQSAQDDYHNAVAANMLARQEQRRAAAEQKNIATAAKKTLNSAREADFRTRGVDHYTDAEGNLQATKNEDGSTRFTPHTGDIEYDDTGHAIRNKRSERGVVTQEQVDAQAPIGPHPNDRGNLYKQNTKSAWDLVGPVQQMRQSADPTVRAAAEQAHADTQKIMRSAARTGFTAMHNEVGAKERDANLAFQSAQASAKAIDTELEAVTKAPGYGKTQGGIFGIGASPTPEAQELAAKEADLKQKRDAISLTPPNPKEFSAARHAARASADAFDFEADKQGSVDAAAEARRQEIADAGGDPAADPVLRAIDKARTLNGIQPGTDAASAAQAASEKSLRAHPAFAPLMQAKDALDTESTRVQEQVKAQSDEFVAKRIAPLRDQIAKSDAQLNDLGAQIDTHAKQLDAAIPGKGDIATRLQSLDPVEMAKVAPILQSADPLTEQRNSLVSERAGVVDAHNQAIAEHQAMFGPGGTVSGKAQEEISAKSQALNEQFSAASESERAKTLPDAARAATRLAADMEKMPAGPDKDKAQATLQGIEENYAGTDFDDAKLKAAETIATGKTLAKMDTQRMEENETVRRTAATINMGTGTGASGGSMYLAQVMNKEEEVQKKHAQERAALLDSLPPDKRAEVEAEAKSERIADSLGKFSQKLTAFDKIKDIALRPEQLIGFVGGAEGLASMAELAGAAYRIQAGTPERDDESIIALYMAKSGQKSTTWYKVIDTLAQQPAFMQELAATGGIYTAARAATMKTGMKLLSNLVEKEGGQWLKKALEQKVIGGVAKFAGKSLATMIAALPQTPLAAAPKIVSGMIERMAPTIGFTGDDQGRLKAIVEQDGKGAFSAGMRAFGDQYVEIFTENTGGAIAPLEKWFGKAAGKVIEKIPAGLRAKVAKLAVVNTWLKKNAGAGVSDFSAALKKGGWHGVIGEMFEERVGDLSRGLADAAEQKLNGKSFGAAIAHAWNTYAPDAEQLKVEGISFAIPAAASHVADRHAEHKAMDQHFGAQSEALKQFAAHRDFHTPERVDKELAHLPTPAAAALGAQETAAIGGELHAMDHRIGDLNTQLDEASRPHGLTRSIDREARDHVAAELLSAHKARVELIGNAQKSVEISKASQEIESLPKHPDVVGADPVHIEQAQNLARAVVRVATGHPLESLSAAERVALDTPIQNTDAAGNTTEIPRYEQVGQHVVLTQDGIDRLKRIVPAVAGLVKESEAERRQSIQAQEGGETTNGDQSKTGTEGETRDAKKEGLLKQPAAKAAPGELRALDDTETKRAKLLAAVLRNEDVPGPLADRFAHGYISQNGVQNFAQQREGIKTAITAQGGQLRTTHADQAGRAQANGDLHAALHDFDQAALGSHLESEIDNQTQEAVRQLTAEGQNLTPAAKKGIKNVIALIAPATARLQGAFDSVSYTAQGRTGGGASSDRVGNITFSLPDILSPGNLDALQKDPSRAEHIIAEEAIHAIAQKIISRPEMIALWGKLPADLQSLVAESYFEPEEIPKLSSTPDLQYKAGHEFLRMYVQGKLGKKITEQTAPSLVRALGSIFKRLLEYFGKLAERLTAAKVDQATIDTIESAATIIADRLKEVSADAERTNPYVKAYATTSRGLSAASGSKRSAGKAASQSGGTRPGAKSGQDQSGGNANATADPLGSIPSDSEATRAELARLQGEAAQRAEAEERAKARRNDAVQASAGRLADFASVLEQVPEDAKAGAEELLGQAIHGDASYVVGSNFQRIPSVTVALPPGKVETSHAGEDFHKNPAYGGENTRKYHSDKDEQAKVRKISLPGALDEGSIVTDVKSAAEGPPQIVMAITEGAEGNPEVHWQTAGGNGREMGVNLSSLEDQERLSGEWQRRGVMHGLHDVPAGWRGYRFLGVYDLRNTEQAKYYQSLVDRLNPYSGVVQDSATRADIDAKQIPIEELADLPLDMSGAQAVERLTGLLKNAETFGLDRNLMGSVVKNPISAQFYMQRLTLAAAFHSAPLAAFYFDQKSGPALSTSKGLIKAAAGAALQLRKKGAGDVADALGSTLASVADYVQNGDKLSSAIEKAAQQLELGESGKIVNQIATALAGQVRYRELDRNGKRKLDVDATSEGIDELMRDLGAAVSNHSSEADMFGEADTIAATVARAIATNAKRRQERQAEPEGLNSRRATSDAQRIRQLSIKQKEEGLTRAETAELEETERRAGQSFLSIYNREAPKFSDTLAVPPGARVEQPALLSRSVIYPEGEKLPSELAKAIPKDATPEQHAGLSAIYAKLHEEQPKFRAQVEAFAAKHGSGVIHGPAKAPAKIIQKVNDPQSGYGGNVGKVMDVMRSSIVVPSIEAAKELAKEIKGEFEIARVNGKERFKDRFAEPLSSGYRDMLINVMHEGIIAEVQVHIPEILDAKQNPKFIPVLNAYHSGHEVYDMMLTEELQNPGSTLFQKTIEAGNYLYGSATQLAIQRAKDSKDSSIPFLLSLTGIPSNSGEESGNGPTSDLPSSTLKNPLPGTSTTGSPSKSQNLASGGNSEGRGTEGSAGITVKNIPESSQAVSGKDAALPESSLWKQFDREKFDGAPHHQLVKLARLISYNAAPEDETGREPIDVHANADGTFRVVRGDATAQRLMRAKWNMAPVNVVSADAPVDVPLAARRAQFDANQFDMFGGNALTPSAPASNQTKNENKPAATTPRGSSTTAKRPGMANGLGALFGDQPDLFSPNAGAAAGNASGASNRGDGDGGEAGDGTGGLNGDGGGATDSDQSGYTDPGGSETDQPRDGAETRRLARIAVQRALPVEQQNHRIEPGDVLIAGGDKAKLAANIAAIRLMRTLQADGDRNATSEEKRTLAQYVGWGGLSNALNDLEASKRTWNLRSYSNGYDHFQNWQREWGAAYDELKGLLTADEWEAAKKSTENAHYTDREVISAMWKAVEAMGFKAGRVLEPGAGIGHFFGLAPADIADASELLGVELDETSGAILKKIYPQAQIQIKGFEKANIPDNSIDLAISNVPFSEVGVYDPAHADTSLNLHNYFFAKALDKVKPGGVIAFITSNSTMDNNRRQRAYLAERGELIGAVRLPNNAFKKNAGTEVVTDIVFLRKADGREVMPKETWGATKQVGTAPVTVKDARGDETTTEEPIVINEYFAKHPEMALGRHTLEGSMYRAGQYTMKAEGGDFTGKLAAALDRLPAGLFNQHDSAPGAPTNDYVKGEWKPGQFIEQDGVLGVNERGSLVPLADFHPVFGDIKKKTAAIRKVRDFMRLRDSYRSLIELMRQEDATEADIKDGQADILRLYNSWVLEHGELASGRHKILNSDPDYYMVLGLEKVKVTFTPTGKKELHVSKADVFTKRTISPVSVPTEAASSLDAMRISQSWKGMIDLGWVAQLAGKSIEAAKFELIQAGSVFEDPSTGLLQTREQYLSGNVRRKLAAVRQAVESNPELQRNVDALEKVQPEPISISNIGVKLGAGWIPEEVINGFGHELFGFSENTHNPHFKATYTQAGDSDSWTLTTGSYLRNSTTNTSTYAGGDLSGVKLLEMTLNLSSPTIYFPQAKGEARQVDTKSTAAARLAQEKIKEAFAAYSKSSSPVTLTIDGKRDTMPVFEAVQRVYNSTFNTHVDPTYDGSHLTLPGSASHVMLAPEQGGLRPHQKDGIHRAIQEGSVMLAHGVGTGKTNELIAISAEWKRLGTSKKPMIVVQNATLEQFAASYKRMYPGNSIIVGTHEDLAGEKRKAFMARVASGDWDAVIVPHSSFSLIPDDPDYEKGFVNTQLAEIEEVLLERLKELAADRVSAKDQEKDPTVKQLVKTKRRWEEKLAKASDRAQDNTLTFQQLGVDSLLVDEAHLFKKVPFYTRMERVAGLDISNSDRAYGLWLKLRAIQDSHAGKNVVLATGTPITNTIAEAWNMLRLVNPNALTEFHVETFDKFASAFGEVSASLEMSPTGKWKMRQRFGSFVNVPELQKMLRSSWDIKDGKDLDLGRPTLETGGPIGVAVPKTDPVGRYMKYLDGIYQSWEKLKGEDKKELSYIPLIIYGVGKAATLDMRLVVPDAPDNAGSKVNRMVTDAVRYYKESQEHLGTQLIFADAYRQVSTDKLDAFAGGEKPVLSDEAEQDDDEAAEAAAASDTTRFNLYIDIKRKLIEAGIPAHEVAIIDQAKNAAQREKLFDQVKAGGVRFLIGSTQKMGTGVNVQDRIYALHNLDAPWTPADLEQRNGRAWRAGNIHAELGIPIKILNYGMEGTIDAGLFQIIETKARFTNEALTTTERTVSDIGGGPQETAAMLKALFSGDPRAIERVKLESTERQLTNAYAGWEQNVSKARSGIFQAQRQIKNAIEGYPVQQGTEPAYHEPGLNDMRPLADQLKALTSPPGLRFTRGNSAPINDEKPIAAAINEAIEKAKPGMMEAAKTSAFAENQTIMRGTIRGLKFEVSGKVLMQQVQPKEERKFEIGSAEAKPTTEYAFRATVTYSMGDRQLREKSITSNSGAAFLEGVKDIDGYFDGRIAGMEAAIARQRAQINELEKTANEPFTKAAQLEKVRADLRELETSLIDAPEEPAETPLESRRAPADTGTFEFDFETGENANDRVTKNLGLADRIAAGFDNIPGADTGDRQSVARTALVRAARSYVPGSGTPFGAYAGVAIKNALRSMFGNEVRHAKTNAATLDISTGEDFDSTPKDAIRDNSQDVQKSAALNDARSLLDELLGELPPHLRSVLEGIRDGKSLSEIGAEIPGGVTKQGVARRADTAMLAMRQKLGERGVRGTSDMLNSRRIIGNLLDGLDARKAADPGGSSPYDLMAALEAFAATEKPGQRTIGRPDLALSTLSPAVQAVDEWRKDSTQPQTQAEWQAEAEKMLATDPRGTRQRIIAKALSGDQLGAVETKAAMLLVAQMSRETASEPSGSPAKQELYILVNAYRSARSEQARGLASGRDPFKTPADRHREFLSKVIYTPGPKVRAQLDAAKDRAEREAIFAEDRKRIEKIEEALKKAGITMEDIFSGDAEIRMKNAPIAAEVIESAETKEEKEALKHIMAGTAPDVIAKKTGYALDRQSGIKAKAIQKLREKFFEQFKAGTKADAIQSRPAVSDADAEAEFQKLLDSIGLGTRAIRTFDITNAAHVLRAARMAHAVQSNVVDMLYEAWINNVLSGPATHAANVFGNAGAIAWDFTVQRGMEAMLNLAMQNDQAAQVGEIGQIIKGILPGMATGIRLAAAAWSNEYDFSRQFMLDEPIALSTYDKGGNQGAAIPGATGRVIRVPGRALMFADSFFKGLAGRMEAGAQSYRIATAEGLTGAAKASRIRSLVETPGSAAWIAAAAKAEELTFQQDLKKARNGGNLVEDIASKVQDARSDNKLLGYIIPFVKTPYNVFRTGLRKSPFGSIPLAYNLSGALIGKIRNGRPVSASMNTPEQIRDLAEQVIAWSAMALMWGAAQGDPDDDKKKFLLTGSMPATETTKGERALQERAYGGSYILRIGGRGGMSFNFGRYEPFATTLGTMVDVIRAMKRGTPAADKMDALFGYFVAQAQSKTFLQGVADMMKAVQDGQGSAQKTGKALMQALVPNIIRQPLRNVDDYMRDSRSAGPAYTLLPSAGNAQPKIDSNGRPAAKTGNSISRLFFPAGTQPYPELTKVDKMLIRWNLQNPSEKWSPTEPTRTYKREGKDVDMTATEYRNYSERVGRRVTELLSGQISPRQVDQPRHEDIDQVRGIFEKARREVKESMFHPTLKKIAPSAATAWK